ncbi:hypothetical protein MSIM_48820 [Mycobacterium simiae]|nr:hypothetical protein MSIM_48820 [Mycobacterium simiae]
MPSRYTGDTEGATITQIASELGVSEATLSGWCRLAGVAIRHGKPGSASMPAARMETREQELIRLRAEVTALRGDQARLATERDILSVGGEVFRWADELVSRSQFVAVHRDAFEVKWLTRPDAACGGDFYREIRCRTTEDVDYWQPAMFDSAVFLPIRSDASLEMWWGAALIAGVAAA